MPLREKYPLHPNKVFKKAIESSLLVILPALFISFFGLVSPIFLLCIPLAVLAVIGIYWWSKEYYRVYFYDLTSRGLEMKKGVFFPNSITIPMEKISDIYVDQDIFDRLLDIYDLHFSSASTSSGMHAHIDGMGKETTDALKAFLMGQFGGGKAGEEQFSSSAAQSKPLPLSAQIASSGEIATFRPAPAGYWLELMGALLGTTLMLLFLFPPLALGIFILAFPVAFYINKEYESRIYKVRQDGLWIRKGWLTPSETLLLYKNIQDTDVTQDLLSRLFGLHHVSVKSMSVLSAMGARLTYLTDEDANRLQELVRKQIEKPSSAQKTSATGSFAQLSIAPIKYEGEKLVKPYRNNFIPGHLLGSLPLIILLFIAALLIFLISPAMGVQYAYVISGFIVFLAFGAAVLSFIMALIDEQTYSYSLSENGLTIELGLLSRYKKVIRYEKIQDIKLHCGFVDSFFGFANMEIETGSKDVLQSNEGRGAAASMATLTERIPYLKLQDVYALRSRLLGICGIAYPSSQQPLRQALPLSQKKPLKKTVAYVGILTIQVLLTGLLIALFGQSSLPYIGMGIALLALLNMTLVAFIVYTYEQMYMQKYFYDGNSETLVIRKGVFGWNEIVVPYRNIQSIYVDQDWYDVYFDTWDVWITTVTATSGPMAHIDGTCREDAEKLARLLADRVEKSRKRNKG